MAKPRPVPGCERVKSSSARNNEADHEDADRGGEPGEEVADACQPLLELVAQVLCHSVNSGSSARHQRSRRTAGRASAGAA
jgi:hypothetical protein